MAQFSPLVNFVSWPQIVISKCLQLISGGGSVHFPRAGISLFSHDDSFCLQINSWKDTGHIMRFTDELLCASMLLLQQRNTSE